MGKDSPDAAPPRQLDVELSQILSQWPALLRGEQENTPGAVKNDLSNLNLSLEGADGTTGLYDLLASGTDRVGGIQREADSTARGAAYADLRNLNPEQSRLYDALAADAEAGLKAGDRLTREETFNTVNPIRNDWAARGLGNSAPAQLDEAVNLVTAGRGVGQQRRANAGAVASLGNQMYTAPALAYASDDVSGAQSFMGFGSGYSQQPSILEQLGGYSQDIFQGNWNAENANNINRANARNATTTGAVTAGTAIGLALLCWAAREVFGAEDPKWKQFREWMLLRGPIKFRNWYLMHGERWARRLAANPVAKNVVRRWMERRIVEVSHV